MSNDANEHEHSSTSHEGEHGDEGHSHDRPRPDDTPPRNGAIFLYTVLSVLFLVSLKFVLDSYLENARRNVRADNLGASDSSERLEQHRDAVAGELAGGDLPIDQAISQLAERGRGAFPQVRPYPSEDQGAREGWNRRPPEAPPLTPEPSEATVPAAR